MRNETIFVVRRKARGGKRLFRRETDLVRGEGNGMEAGGGPEGMERAFALRNSLALTTQPICYLRSLKYPLAT